METALISNVSYIVITLIRQGYARQDAVIKAKSQLGINRYLTEDEKNQLAQNIHAEFPGMELSDIMWYINLAESMPGYSSGGIPEGGIPDVVIPEQNNSGIIIAGSALALIILIRLIK